MNQYSAITANIVANETAPAATTENVEPATAANETVVDLAAKVSASTADANVPGTSADARKRNQEDLIKIEDLGSDDQEDEVRNINSGETSEASELRRRRLQKFLQTEQRNEWVRKGYSCLSKGEKWNKKWKTKN